MENEGKGLETVPSGMATVLGMLPLSLLRKGNEGRDDVLASTQKYLITCSVLAYNSVKMGITAVVARKVTPTTIS